MATFMSVLCMNIDSASSFQNILSPWNIQYTFENISIFAFVVHPVQVIFQRAECTAWRLYSSWSLYISKNTKRWMSVIRFSEAGFFPLGKNCGPRMDIHRVNIPSVRVKQKSSQLQSKNPGENQCMWKL